MHPNYSQRLLLVCFSFLILSGTGLSAQSSQAEHDGNDDKHDSLRMVVDYGQGKQKQRRSHRGVMEPVGMPVGSVVEISLEFPKTMVGYPVVIVPLDGGQISASMQPLVVAANGTVDFSFEAGSTAGLYRLQVRGAQPCELQLYAFDPNRARTRPGGAGRP